MAPRYNSKHKKIRNGQMKRVLSFLLFLLVTLATWAQVDSLAIPMIEEPQPAFEAVEPDTQAVLILQLEYERDSIVELLRNSNKSLSLFSDSLAILHDELAHAQKMFALTSRMKDSLTVANDQYQIELTEKNRMLEEKNRLLVEKEALVAEKEQLYRDALSASTIDRAKLEADITARQASIDAKSKEIEFLQRGIDDKSSSLSDQKAAYERLSQENKYYMQVIDSLRNRVIAADKENIRKQEENKYLAQRAKEAEEKVSTATNRKKKVRPIQGIAMRFYRTPEWTISLTPRTDENNNKVYDKQIWNRNAGNMEFDFITGASVMLWDLTPVFNKPDTARTHLTDIRGFDQQFSYDLGLHVAFGGSNLFKNFYVGPSFRFMDFFYLTMGVNVCEFEVLKDGVRNYDIIDASQNMTDVICKKWLVKPFLSFSIDLDFLSYIKR